MRVLDQEIKLGPLRVFADGLCEPAPGGLATYGFVVYGPTGTELHREGGVVAEGSGATNNVAEYGAVVRALRWLLGEGGRGGGAGLESLEILSDSQLVVRQLSGEWAVKSELLRPRYEAARNLMGRFGEARASCIPREQNEEADALSVAAYVRVLEKPRRERAGEVSLEALGQPGLFLSNGRWRVDAVLGLCTCPDFRVHNTRRFRVRCKHLFAADLAWKGGASEISETARAAGR